MYWVNTYTFCANTVNFWDSYNAFWKVCLKMQNRISKKKKKKKKKQPKFSEILGQSEKGKQTSFFRPHVYFLW